MGFDYDILRNQILEIVGRVDTISTHRTRILVGLMTAIVVPASIAVMELPVSLRPMPFLVSDIFDAVGQLVVVRDEDWDEVVERCIQLSPEDNLPTIIETEDGPFMVVYAKRED